MKAEGGGGGGGGGGHWDPPLPSDISQTICTNVRNTCHTLSPTPTKSPVCSPGTPSSIDIVELL